MAESITVEKANALLRDLDDEITSANEYITYAVNTSDMTEKKVLNAIAKDEYTHAMYLYEYLEESGVTIPDDIKSEYKDLVDDGWKFCQ